ncbi:MAG: hypothetical protein ABJC19_04230 [Gemmatimonadota bacterium]
MCQLGCLPPEDVDPAPEQPGEWIGAAFSGGYCFGDEGNDLDLDGIVDQCEWKLAETFAPQMNSEASDDVGGEPYFAVQRVAGDPNAIIILYLFSYYEDLGCWNFSGCTIAEDSHSGDSEAVGVYVRFDADFQHWIVDGVIMFQHGHDKSYLRAFGAFPTGLEYVGRDGGKFKVHVSGGKHASYATVSECQSGGTLGSDHYSPGQVSWVLDTPAGRNLGSNTAKFKNCVYSFDRYALTGEQECHWTGATFTGWQGPTQNAPPGNYKNLRYFKFLPCTPNELLDIRCAVRG